MLRLLLAAISLTACPVTGTYHAPHTVRMVCEDGWCEEETEDAMTITAAGDGTIHASIELVQTNGHTCTFEGNLAPEPPPSTRWVHRSDPADEFPCTLTLDRSATEVSIQADGCRDYCGSRASLDASFPVRPR